MKKRKSYLIITIVITLIFIIGITSAYFLWTNDVTTDTNVTLTMNGAPVSILYVKGADITGAELTPTNTKENGIMKRIKVSINKTPTSPVTINYYLDVESLPTSLRHNTFKWEFYKNDTLINTNNFAGVTEGSTIALASNQFVTTTQDTYKLYLWIDGTVDNPGEMAGKTFSFKLRADGENAIYEETAPVSELTHPNPQITGGTEGENGWYKSNVIVKINGGSDAEIGIKKTTYKIEGATTLAETEISSGNTITISNEGISNITVYTYNNNDDVLSKSLEVKKDTIGPVISYSGSGTTWNYEHTGLPFTIYVPDGGMDYSSPGHNAPEITDNASGVNSSSILFSPLTVPSYGSHNVSISVKDNAGNTTTISQNVSVQYCFVAGTLVYINNGYKNIEDIKVGDKVYSKNTKTNKLELNTVTAVRNRLTKDIYTVKTSKDTFKVTGEHPFYVVNKGWIMVKDLKKGDKLIDTNDEIIHVTSIEFNKLKEAVRVYTFTVADNHNYFVGEGKILVHNKPS